jgi:hypothetical protein
MDFIKYIGNLLFTAFLWNSNNPLFIFFGWLTGVFSIIIFGVPKVKEHWENKILRQLKKHRVLILMALIFASLIISAYSLQSGGNIPSEHRPILKFDSNITNVFVNDDDVKQMTNIDVVFHIDNVGDRAAYQFYAKVCFAPAKTYHEIEDFPDVIGRNPIQPHEVKLDQKTIYESFTRSGNKKLVENTIWYIYYELKYNDTPKGEHWYSTNGHWYSDQYWFALDINSALPVRDLSAEEGQKFQPVVHVHYGK